LFTTENFHTPVLLQEAVNYLLTVTNGIFVDGTLGGGGYARAIAERLSPEGKLIAFDVDEDAIAQASQRLVKFGGKVSIVQANFSMVKEVLQQLNISAIDGLVLDLGVSSYQLDEPSKGFSFQSESPLDMRMDRRLPMNAGDVVNLYDERLLAEILWKYGEERYSRRIAHAIVERRKSGLIRTTTELVDTVSRVIPRAQRQKSLARIFQAIRIEVNHELDNLRTTLVDGIELLKRGGRIVVVSYHSLEDRIVKEVMKTAAGKMPSASFIGSGEEPSPTLKIITKKPITPSEEEVRRNPRSRSAKMRVAERI
jgi:16S rRNA (cytosine1402-N4)-methyltransferase